MEGTKRVATTTRLRPLVPEGWEGMKMVEERFILLRFIPRNTYNWLIRYLNT